MEPDRCTCGHTRAAHNYRVIPSDPFMHCSGTVFAIDDDAEYGDPRRETSCCCTSFVRADQGLLEGWAIA